jgi:hypothetical protein
MAPESFDENHSLSTVTDLYAVGLLLHQMIIGRLPFYPHHPSLPDLMKRMPPPLQVCWQHLNLNPLPLRGVPDEINSIVLDLLKKKPEERIQSSHELIKKIERALQLHFQENYSSATELLPQDLFKQWLDDHPTAVKAKTGALNDPLSLGAPIDPRLDNQVSESSVYNTSSLKPIRPVQPLPLNTSPASRAARHDLPLVSSPLLSVPKPPLLDVSPHQQPSAQMSDDRSPSRRDHIKTVPIHASSHPTLNIFSSLSEEQLSSTLALKPNEMKALNAELEKMLTNRTELDLTELISSKPSAVDKTPPPPQKPIHSRSTLALFQRESDKITLSQARFNASSPQKQIDYNSTPTDLSAERRQKQKELFFGVVALLASMGLVYFLLTYFIFYFR